MPTFAIETQSEDDVAEYFKKSDKKLRQSFFVHSSGQKIPNIMTGRIIRLGANFYDTYIINQRCIIPNFLWFPALVWAVPVLWLNNWKPTAWLIPSIVFLCMMFFWSKSFIFIAIKRSLRKLGYQGTIIKLNNDECINRLIDRLPM